MLTDNHCLKNGIMQSGSVIASKLLKLDLGAFGGEAEGVDNKVIKTKHCQKLSRD